MTSTDAPDPDLTHLPGQTTFPVTNDDTIATLLQRAGMLSPDADTRGTFSMPDTWKLIRATVRLWRAHGQSHVPSVHPSWRIVRAVMRALASLQTHGMIR